MLHELAQHEQANLDAVREALDIIIDVAYPVELRRELAAMLGGDNRSSMGLDTVLPKGETPLPAEDRLHGTPATDDLSGSVDEHLSTQASEVWLMLPAVRRHRAEARRREGDTAGYQQNLLAALEADPCDADSLAALAELAWRHGQKHQAEAHESRLAQVADPRTLHAYREASVSFREPETSERAQGRRPGVIGALLRLLGRR